MAWRVSTGSRVSGWCQVMSGCWCSAVRVGFGWRLSGSGGVGLLCEQMPVDGVVWRVMRMDRMAELLLMSRDRLRWKVLKASPWSGEVAAHRRQGV